MQDRSEPIALGESAPEFTLKSSEDAIFNSQEQIDKPTVIMFMREFTCIQCRNNLATLARNYAEIQAQGAQVVVIGGGNVKQAHALMQTYHPPFQILADTNRDVYRAFGINKMMFIQRNATFVIDGDGIVQHVNEAVIPGAGFDYPSLLRTLKNLQGTPTP